MEYRIQIIWDQEAAVWIASSREVRGLIIESESVDLLIERLRSIVPELLVLNHQPPAKALRIEMERLEQLANG